MSTASHLVSKAALPSPGRVSRGRRPLRTGAAHSRLVSPFVLCQERKLQTVQASRAAQLVACGSGPADVALPARESRGAGPSVEQLGL